MNFLSELSVAPTWLWLSFIIGVFILLIFDLIVFGRNKNHTHKSAVIESAMWISIALLFNIWFWFQYGNELGLEFLTGYLVEKSLSIDNLFIILLVFQSLKIPKENQHRVLFYGILGAVFFRAIFILLGAKLIHQFDWILYIFGIILIITSIKFLKDTDKEINIKKNWSLLLLQKLLPITTEFNKDKFFIRTKGVLFATPMFVALIVIEATDIIFAVDSIPAVFSVTQDAFVAFASNILAILGLRSLFFVLAIWVADLKYLKPGLAAILGFIGIKMLIVDLFHIPSWVSLLVITGILTTAGLSSWYVRQQPKL